MDTLWYFSVVPAGVLSTSTLGTMNFNSTTTVVVVASHVVGYEK
jgi:hypothetical protein